MKLEIQPAALDLSVLLPALHEQPNLAILLPELRGALDGLGISWEVLVVDGDSRDGTDSLLHELGEPFRYVQELSKGYDRAILRGIQEARGKYLITMDADMSHPVEFVNQLWTHRDDGEVVIASRYVEGGHADQPAFRSFLSRVLNRFFAAGLSMNLLDMTSGFRLYHRRIFNHIQPEFSNFVVLVEILLIAFQRGYKIAEVPFTYKPRKEGGSNARILQFGFEYLRLFRKLWALRNSVEFPDYDWRAHDSRIWFQRYWQRKRHGIILDFTPENVSICDVGCGSSRILAALPHAVGVDLQHNKLAFMRATNKLLVCGNGMGLPFPDESFECVISSEVIEHIPDEEGRHIDELVRILKPGGTLILGTPDYGGWQWPFIEWVYGKVAPGAYADEHCNPYTFQSLKEAIEARGCVVNRHGYICKAELIFEATKQA